MPSAEVSLPGHASSVPTARRFVESMLSAWGHPDAGWSAALCISELAANCTLHARTDFSVRVQTEGGTVRLEVSDASPRIPATRGYTTDATTGRGLRLIGEYAASWGVEPRPDGKTVWVLLDAGKAAGLPDEPDEDVPVDALLAAFSGEDGGPVANDRGWTWQAAA